MRKLRKDDEVIITAGKDKGKRGKILRFVNERRIIVEGLNLVKKHVKPNPQKDEVGGIVEKEAALDISNAAIYNPKTKKADRVGFNILEDNRKVRIFKSNKEVIDV